MAQTPPPAITSAPTPAPQRGDRATFSSRVDAFVTWVSAAVAQFAAVATNTYSNAVDAYNNATIAASSADIALSVVGAVIFNPATNYAQGQAAISGIDFQAYRRRTAGISATDPGADSVNWVRISAGLWGPPVASAATINLSAAYDFRHVTGTTPINAITIPVGAERTIIFDGILPLAHSAGLLLPGAANITTAAGDRMIARGDTAGAIVVSYNRASGQAVIPSAVQLLATAVVSTPVANVDFLSLFTAAYDKYTIDISGLTCSVTATLTMRFGVAGAADGSASYTSRLTDNTGVTGTTQTGANITSTTVSTGVVNAIVNFLNANSTTSKLATIAGNYNLSAGDFTGIGGSVIYSGATAVTGFRLLMTSGNITGGTIRVYGHRNT